MIRGVTIAAVVAILAMLLCSGLSVPGQGSARATVPAASPHVSVTPETVPISAFATGMAASLVLGAPNLTTYWNSLNASALIPVPESAAMDSHGDLWVLDTGSSRVVEFAAPLSDGEAASLVIGQSTFSGAAQGRGPTNLSGPSAIAFDPRGDLWVSDWNNNRVLEFVRPFYSGMAASLVIGQSNFAGHLPATTAVNLSDPYGMSFDSFGDLWLADLDNDRVLEYVPPFTDGMAASTVLGQSNFTSSAAGMTGTTLDGPTDVVTAGDMLWVTDRTNERVLGYYEPFATGNSATIVLGQSSLTASGATGEAALSLPNSVSADGSGNLWVTDSGDNRVLEFAPPFSDLEDPTVALGQPSLTGVTAGDTATTLDGPYDAFVAASGDLWVVDGENNRVLAYVPQHYEVTVSETGLPSGTAWTASVDGQGMTGTGSLLFSEVNGTHALQVTPVAGYRANPAVGGFSVNGTAASVSVEFSPTAPNPFSSGMPATIVLGQLNFVTRNAYLTANASELRVEGNNAFTFDSSGDLWTVDAGFSRVLEFRPPFTNFMAASLVLGQFSFSGGLSGDGATNLAYPDGLAFDSSGDLWVSDTGNNRVLEFTPPFTSGMAATLVIGQTGFGTDTSGHSATQLYGPEGISFSGGALWVADEENNRVVSFPPPLVTGEAATVVLGQSTLSGSLSGLSPTNLSSPSGVAFDSHGNAWVADFRNNRVLEYGSPLVFGEAAAAVLGQPNLTTNTASYPNSFDEPWGVFVDTHGDVWVADFEKNRVLEFIGPDTSIESNATPAIVIGQGNLTTGGPSTTRTGLWFPAGAAIDPSGNLWVTDNENGRILGYDPTPYPLNFTAEGLPASTPWGVSVNGTVVRGSGSSAIESEDNGTFDWTAAPVAGWSASPSSGTATVNGAGANVKIAFTPVTYSVMFTETGLPSGTNWSVTLGTATHYGTSATIGFEEPNGSYAYAVGTVPGYSSASSPSLVSITGGAGSVTVTFTGVSASASSSGLSTTDLLLIALIVVIVAVGAAFVLTRQSKGNAPPPTRWAPPPGAAAPPPPANPPPPPT
jgi:sugar lactone lactonase YvrE